MKFQIVVLVIILVLLALTGIAVYGPNSPRSQRVQKAKAQIKQIEIVFDQYYVEWGHYPKQPVVGVIDADLWSSIRDRQTGVPLFRLEDFDYDTTDSATVDAKAYYRPVNVYSQPFYYQSPGSVHPDGFDLWCAGRDGKFGAQNSDDPTAAQAPNARTDDRSDDIANWKRLH